VACADKADLTRIGTALPQGAAPPAKAHGHCLQVGPGLVKIDRVEGTYSCVHQSSDRCLWVPSELIGGAVRYDGAF
jgi:hypothetical protein